MPGDTLVPHARYRATRGITIAATPEEVWPWLVQMRGARRDLPTPVKVESAPPKGRTSVLISCGKEEGGGSRTSEGTRHMSADDSVGRGVLPLAADACWELLPRARVGRLAWNHPDGRILVVPVNFGLDGHTILIRTGDTVLLGAAKAGERCAFQADELEPGLRSGWTVLVDGRLGVVTEPVSVERLGQLVTPWLRVPRPHVLLLEAMQVSGRVLQAVGGVEVVAFDGDERP